MIPYAREAYELLHEGCVALAQVEANGIRIDEAYLARAKRKMARRIKKTTSQLMDDEVVKVWKKEYGKKFKLGSGEQLGHVLFDVMGHEAEKTEGGQHKTDESALGKVDLPFVKKYLTLKKDQKCLTTYLEGIEREVVDGLLHPFFNLHRVQTYRSSSDSPNFQNQPGRDPVYGKIVRQAFIARPGCRIVELDYSGVEVGIAACYHKDPTMMSYLEDDTKDMHRDMAAECFKLPVEQLIPQDKADAKRCKQIRYCGKNMFVFPQFYGDWYIDNARHLWEATENPALCLRDGTTIRDHLRKKGIRELGELDPTEKPGKHTMEGHIQKVEKAFWGKRFPVYDKWRKTWVNKYMEKGWMLTKTGFICQGPNKRNEIINYPVQGSAFHCLLRSLIDLQNELNRRKMKTLIIGQIHDSIIADVPDEELDEFLVLANHVMVTQLKSKWSWIITPLEVEAEVTPVDGNWFQKAEMPIPSAA